jgi:hypothetical protein
MQILLGQLGYAQQISGEVSSAPGVTRLLALAAPALGIIAWLRANSTTTRIVSSALVVFLGLLLSMAGFRGSAAVFVYVAVLLALTMRHWSVEKGRIWATLACAGLLAVTGLILGSVAREVGANDFKRSGVSAEVSAVLEMPTPSHPREETAAMVRNQSLSMSESGWRINRLSFLDRAVNWQGAIPHEMSLANQARAAIPRLFWPSKPPVDYPVVVADRFYGVSDGVTAMSITTLGDAWLHASWAGVVLLATVTGALLGAAPLVARIAPNAAALLLASAYPEFLDLEAPILLSLVEAVRTLCVVVGAFVVARLASLIVRFVRGGVPHIRIAFSLQ